MYKCDANHCQCTLATTLGLNQLTVTHDQRVGHDSIAIDGLSVLIGLNVVDFPTPV